MEIISKEMFSSIIDDLYNESHRIYSINELLSTDDIENPLIDTVINILEEIFDDRATIISTWCYYYDFGHDFKSEFNKPTGEKFIVHNNDELYDILIHNKNNHKLEDNYQDGHSRTEN